ncbi:MAG TPA: hypothetical protein VLW25_06240 [Bryobacteraceae bacterium]|nr:hypothetical protein [Bryobacteraceae bacterium]HUJ49776.1 hypothetical protein [Bryobacteraceae bacterium]
MRSLLLVAVAPAIFADQLTVSSYSATPGTTVGSYTYLDSTGTELTDGVLGVIPFASQSQADPWVGWYGTNPDITFNFAGPVDVTQVDLDLGLWTNPALIYLPSSIDIGGTTFNLVGNELTNPSRGTLSFNVNFTGITSLDVNLTAGGTYLFMDEAQFFGNTSSGTSTVPEPGSLPLVLVAIGPLVWKASRWRCAAA